MTTICAVPLAENAPKSRSTGDLPARISTGVAAPAGASIVPGMGAGILRHLRRYLSGNNTALFVSNWVKSGQRSAVSRIFNRIPTHTPL